MSQERKEASPARFEPDRYASAYDRGASRQSGQRTIVPREFTSLGDDTAVVRALGDIHRLLIFVQRPDGCQLLAGTGGAADLATVHEPVTAFVPACPLERLGSTPFLTDHRLRYAYVAGAMANGIASVRLVEAIAQSGMLGFFGAAGLSLDEVERAIDQLAQSLGDAPYGFNLIHTPSEPEVEAGIVDLYIRRGVHLAEASAFLDLTLPLVRYRLRGIHRAADGTIVTPNRLLAKVSRVEVASKFFAPAPERLVAKLLERGDITDDEAQLARHVPMAQDVTAEADSGGHTDNRPALTLLPTFLALRNRMQQKYGFAQELRVGFGGGIATPQAAAAAFTMGAAYVLVGSVHQACVESGTSDSVRAMLAKAEQADVTMAPAPDMFEMGVKVQVLKRGTLFAVRGAKLFELYRRHGSLDELPPKERAQLEKTIFRKPLETIWQETRDYFRARDPSQAERAEADPKHKMALVFRWYLGLASRWANSGEPGRELDYQVWCGPAMGAFNEWARGSALEAPAERRVATVALNILYGAAVGLRQGWLRQQGVTLGPGALCSLGSSPLEPTELLDRIRPVESSV